MATLDDEQEPFLIFGQPSISEEEIDEVVATLRSGWIGTGPKVVRFQDDFSGYVGANYARALSSCTAGLHLSLLVAGIGPGDEVITTTLTFPASVNAILHTGARPVLVDVDRRTQNLIPEQVADAVTSRTRAIMPVHMAGRPCDLDAIQAIADEHGLVVIEDAAHAIGGSYHGRMIGAISDLTVFSFYATKNLTTAEGGMVTTGRADWADDIEVYGLHGLSKGAWERYSGAPAKHYAAVLPGFKYNMTDIQASLGLHQLPRIEPWLARREEVWRRYDEAFADLPVAIPPAAEPNTVHARHLYTLHIDIDETGRSRDDFREDLTRRGIGTGIHFVAVHLHPYYQQHLDHPVGSLPHAEWISERTVSLPLSPFLTDLDVERVIDSVRSAVLRTDQAAAEPALT